MPPHHQPVRAEQRFHGNRRCPVCHGSADDPRGTGSRCYGFRASDPSWVHCTRPERAGHLPLNSDTYAHRLRGGCPCGAWHDDPDVRPFDVADRTTYTGNGNGAGHEDEPAAGETLGPLIQFEIRDQAGALQAIHCRRDVLKADGTRDGKKKRMWWAGGLGGRPVTSLPLYGVHQLADYPPDVPTFLVEGEKKRDALTARGFAAVATVCGAGTIPDDAALQPLVGRLLVVSPDNDADTGKGVRHMSRIIASLRRLGQPDDRLRWLTWAEAPPDGGDLADFFDQRGKTREELIAELRAMIAAAPPAPASTETNGNGRQTPSQSDQLLALCEPFELFVDHTREVAYAYVPNGQHHETWPLRSVGFRR